MRSAFQVSLVLGAASALGLFVHATLSTQGPESKILSSPAQVEPRQTPRSTPHPFRLTGTDVRPQGWALTTDHGTQSARIEPVDDHHSTQVHKHEESRLRAPDWNNPEYLKNLEQGLTRSSDGGIDGLPVVNTFDPGPAGTLQDLESIERLERMIETRENRSIDWHLLMEDETVWEE